MTTIEQVGPTLNYLKEFPAPQAPGIEDIVKQDPLAIPANQTGQGGPGSIFSGETVINKTDGTSYQGIKTYG